MKEGNREVQKGREGSFKGGRTRKRLARRVEGRVREWIMEKGSRTS